VLCAAEAAWPQARWREHVIGGNSTALSARIALMCMRSWVFPPHEAYAALRAEERCQGVLRYCDMAKKRRRGSLLLPWPNTMANVRATVRDLRSRGWVAEIEKTDHETYVRTDASMKQVKPPR
jgi:hypothetical protein